MKLQDFATELKAKNNFIKASFGGFAGSGKTRTATEFIIGAYKHLKCKKPILIIDNEKGSRFLVPLFNDAGIETLVKDTIELADVISAFNYLQSGEIDFLFMDSLSKVWYKYVRDYRTKNKKTFMTLQDWGKILPAWQESFSDRFVNLEGNCVFTGRGGYTYDMEENEKGKKEFVKSGVKMKMAGETPFEPDINVWMDLRQEIKDDKPVVWREAIILKDRANLIDGKVFKNPTYKDFRPVVEYLIAVPKGEVKGATDKTNMAPAENYDSQDKRAGKEIELEAIKNQFLLQKFGATAKDKALKLNILDKFFGTSTWGEIEKQEYKQLRDSRIGLVQFFDDAAFEDDKEKFLEDYKPQRDLFDKE
jgi:hypothetical protein